jgi:hypothetical protein
MAYINATFYIDPVSGSDTARTALTSCTASNPSGSITRINKTAHGLVTGAIVDTTLFTAWLNGAFKITVVDADNFDLDDTVWQATADPSGTVTPRGGSSWADAWFTIISGATAARIQGGDTIRISKNDETSTGVDATFASGSKSVTLASAITKTVEHGVSGWTASANVTASTNASRKYGATATVITPAAGFTTGKVCYKAIDGGGTQDFSGYTKISLWFRPTLASLISVSTYKLCLCSDTTGDTIVNEIDLPATLASNAWEIFVLDYGAALSSSVQSVAIYANVDPGATAFSFSNIVACNDVTHETLIGWAGDCFYNVQSFNGTTIAIDSNNTAVGGQGWYGTNGTATLYYVQPYVSRTSGQIHAPTEGGTRLLGRITYSGGWDTGTNTQDGYTYFANNILAGTGFYVQFSLVTAENLVLARFTTPIQLASTSGIASNCVFCGGTNASLAAASANSVYNSKFINNTTGVVSNASILFVSCDFYSTSAYGITAQSGIANFIDCRFANNLSGAFNFTSTSVICSPNQTIPFMRNCLISDSAEVGMATGVFGTLWSFNHDQAAGNHWGFEYSATINRQSSVVHDAEPVAWRVVLTSANRGVNSPVSFKVGEFAVTASALVTFTAWVKKDHATDVHCRIRVLDEVYNLSGVSDTSATKANDTNWEQLTITFTPTETGIVPIFFESWRTGAQSNTYIGSVTCTQ